MPAKMIDKTLALRDLWQETKEKQRARLAEYEPLLAGGDPGRGRQVFFGKKVACAACHRVGRDGGQIGPDLTKVGAIRAPADILESILFPSSTIAQGYEPYLVHTKTGQSLTGLVASKSAELLVVRDSSGKDWRLAKDRIEELRPLPTSLMPEGLERALSREEFRDLTAFLRGLK